MSSIKKACKTESGMASLIALALTVLVLSLGFLSTYFRFPAPAQIQVGLEGSPSIFSYRDDEGKLHFVDKLDKIPEQHRSSAEQRNDLPTLNRVPGRELEGNYSATTTSSVEILVTEWCGYCRKLESFLNEKGIRYKKYDVEKTTKGRALYTRYGSGGIPITLVDKKPIRGYNPEAILEALKIKLPRPSVT